MNHLKSKSVPILLVNGNKIQSYSMLMKPEKVLIVIDAEINTKLNGEMRLQVLIIPIVMRYIKINIVVHIVIILCVKHAFKNE